MSKYTTELRYICETIAGKKESVGATSIAEVISAAREQIFDFDYPLFDATYREIFETKIIRHFYTREICEETYGLWKLRLIDKLNLIMPYYNLLYKSATLEFNPFYDVDVTRTHTGINVGEQNRVQNNTTTEQTAHANRSNIAGSSNESSQNSSSDTSGSWDLYSDTPQGGIDGIVGLPPDETLDGNVYLTNARNIKDTKSEQREGTNTTITTDERNENGEQNSTIIGQNNDKNSITNIEEYSERVIGKQGVDNYSDLLIKFRKTFLNIDMMVIDELRDLFFGLW